jgi:hypothetical protein
MAKEHITQLEKVVLEFLYQTTKGSASAEEIRKGLNFPLLSVDLNSILEDLQNQGLIKLHEEFRASSEPKYDKAVILDAGRKLLDSLKMGIEIEM